MFPTGLARLRVSAEVRVGEHGYSNRNPWRSPSRSKRRPAPRPPLLLRSALILLLPIVAAGCGSSVDAAIDDAQQYERLPVYWAGVRFEDWEVTRLQGFSPNRAFVGMVYGTCSPSGGLEPSCAVPIQLQISPLCWQLEVAARDQVWRTRRIRGAPVGKVDGAPVIFTRRTQIKVYTGQGATPGTALRVLKALRSINTVEPVIGPNDLIPPPAPGVLEGTTPCTTR